jgi:hypothetical protein
MALASAVRAWILRRKAELNPTESGLTLPILWATFLTLFVAGPWLLPGYLFATDWPGSRRLDFPIDVSSSAALQIVLAAGSKVIGGEATGKVFVVSFLFCAAVLAYRAMPAGGFVAGAAAATAYLVNPFVYGRLLYGQLFLLAGYAALPWVALRLRRLLLEPGVIKASMTAASLVLLGILSLHLLLVSMVLVATLVTAHVAANDQRVKYLKGLGPALLLTGLAALGASAYWIVPLLTRRGSEGSALAGIGSGDLAAFAAVPDQRFGLVPNLIGLYGFWAEDTNRFASMKVFVPLWPVFLGALLFVALVGAIAGVRQSDHRLAPWVGGLIAAGAIALILEMGVSHPTTAALVRWLDANLPVYRGMRDAGKWAALLALVYSQMVGLGTAAVLSQVRKRLVRGTQLEWLESLAVALLLALPLYYGNGLLYGAHGEIKPSQYPTGWYAADRILASDSHPGKTLFLPWHEYMSFGFIQNANKVVAPPGPNFFSVPLLVSANPEVSGLPPPTDPDQAAITGLVSAGSQGEWARVLAAHDVKYVLVAREVDWASYGYLSRLSGFVLIGDFGSIILYRDSLSP